MNTIVQKAPLLAEVAKFIVDQNEFDSATMIQAKLVSADTFGVAFSGVKTDAFQMALESRAQLFGEGDSKILGTEKTSTLLGATFYNALSISSTDFDEGHRKAVGHPASLVIPVAFVLGKSLNKSTQEILQSVIVGYEIGTRFSEARVKSKITTYSTGRWGAIASAAAAAFLLDLSIEKTMNALSLASILSPAMLGGSTDVSTGSMSKEGVAWAAQSGLQSALLAQNGFIGPYLFLDEHDDFSRAALLNGLGSSWLINSNYFKPYACCRWLHTGIQAAIELKENNSIDPFTIESIKVKIFPRALDLISSKYPENDIQAQFHLPYVIAVALLFDQITPKLFSDFYLKNSKVWQLIDKIELMPDESYSEMFPAQLPSSVDIKLSNGKSFTKEVLKAPWDAGDHPSEKQLYTKMIIQGGEKAADFWNLLFDIEA